MRVYNELKEDRHAVLADIPHLTTADTNWTVWQEDNKVSITFAQMVTGKPLVKTPNGGNTFATDKRRYYRWRTTSSYGFRRSKNGLAVPYEAHRGLTKVQRWNSMRPNTTMTMFEEETSKGDAFRRSMWEVFGIRHIHDLYPAMNFWGMDNWKGIPDNLKRSFREGSPSQFTVQTFGIKRWGNALEDAVINSEPYLVSLAHEVRGLISDAQLLFWLENAGFTEEMHDNFKLHTPAVRKFLKVMDPKAVERLFYRPFTLADMLRVEEISKSVNNNIHAQYLFRNFPIGAKFHSWQQIYTHLYNKDVVLPFGYTGLAS